MMEYDNSFNIFLGTSNKSLSWLDNPYIEPNVYDITNEWEPVKSKTITLRKCDKKDD